MQHVFICISVYTYLCASDDEGHQWQVLSYGSMFTNNVRICLYVCGIYVYMYFISCNSCLKELFLREYFILCAYREKISYLQQGERMWPRLRGYCLRGPTLLTIGTGQVEQWNNLSLYTCTCMVTCMLYTIVFPLPHRPHIPAPSNLGRGINWWRICTHTYTVSLSALIVSYTVCMGGWMSVDRVSYLFHSSRTSLAVSNASYSVSYTLFSMSTHECMYV